MGFVGPRSPSSILTGFTFKQPLAEPFTGVKTLGDSALTLRHVLLSLDISDLLLLEVGNSPQSPVAPWAGLPVICDLLIDLLPCSWCV